MATITFTIDNGKIARITEALENLYPIPTENGNPQYTPSQWAKECTRRWIIKQVARYEKRKAMDAIPYNEEDGLIQ